jgi:hypothetical protein
MKRRLVPILVLLWTFLPYPTWGQQATCEDQLRTARVALDQLVASRTRGETDAAQVISRLLKQIETLQTQIDLILKGKDKQ